MKKILAVILTACFLTGVLAAAMPAFAAKADAGRKTTVIVEFAGDGVLRAAAEGADVTAARETVKQTRRRAIQAMQAAADVTVRYTYSQVLNGAAIEVRQGDLDALRQTEGVTAVYEISGIKPVREVAAAGDITSGAMIGLEDARKQGLDGTGTAIAVIDGGFEIDHETMRLSDASTAKFSKADIAAVIAANEMNSENIKADDVYKSAKIPFAFDYCDDDAIVMDSHNSVPAHGTHVSGIAAGNSDRLTGIAPEAQVFMFKIDMYDDETFLANLLAAFDDAAKFDIASINLSAGLDLEIASDPTYELLEKAIQNARANGIAVCVAAGNAGAMWTPIYIPDNGVNGIPNSLDGATSVASVDNIYLSEKIGRHPETIWYDGDKQIQVLGASEFFSFPESTEIVAMGKNRETGSLDGKTALLYLDQATYTKPINRILDSDAVGVIMGISVYYNMVWYYDGYSLLEELSLNLPIIIIGDLDAYRLLHLKDKTIRVEISDGEYVEPAETLRISEFSSWAVQDDGSMSVDIAAPGGVIFSSVLGGQYDVYDGTSMASPHVAGAAALLDQVIAKKAPSLTGKEKGDLKESLMMSTADPIPLGDSYTSPRVAGAGLINLSRAVTANAVLVGKDGSSALNIGDKLGDTFRFTVTVKNFSDTVVRYDTLSMDLFRAAYTEEKVFNGETGTFDVRYYLDDGSVPLDFEMQSDMPRSITLQPGDSHTVTVSVQLDSAQTAALAGVFSNGYFLEGYVYLSDSMGKQTALNVPLLGFEGDWAAVPALEAIQDYDGSTTGFMVWRNLREMKLTLLDDTGAVVAEASKSYVKRGNQINANELALMLENVKDGRYTLRIYALPISSADDAGQEYTVSDFLVDNNAPKIVRVQKHRNMDGSGTLTITMREPDLYFVQITGASILNASFEDYYPVDSYDHVDKNGNYVYVLYEEKMPLGWFVVDAYDEMENYDSYGIFSPLRILAMLITNPVELLVRLFYIFNGSDY